MTPILTRKNFILSGVLAPQVTGQDLYTLELYQRFPEAQHPRDSRLVQLNLNDADLDRLACFLISRGKR